MKYQSYLNRLLIGLLLLITPFFFLGGPGYHTPRSFQSFWELGHIIFFFLLSCWLCRFLRGRSALLSPLRLFMYSVSTVFISGVLVEILQMVSSGRSPDGFDVLRNLLGCLIAFAFFIRPPLLNRPWLQHGFRGMVLMLLAFALWPLTRSLIDEHRAARQFPVLADFETPLELDRWVNRAQLREETQLVRHGHKAMRVQLSTAKYSGVSMHYFPGDWRGYNTLHYSVYNPHPVGLILNCRIHDTHHKAHGQAYADRFNQQFTLQQGWNDLVVSLDKVKNAPKGRTMDMEQIEGFGVFVVQQAQPMEMYLDYVYLGK